MAEVHQLINPPGPITCLAYNKDRTCMSGGKRGVGGARGRREKRRRRDWAVERRESRCASSE